jgi:hypothetical protein
MIAETSSPTKTMTSMYASREFANRGAFTVPTVAIAFTCARSACRNTARDNRTNAAFIVKGASALRTCRKFGDQYLVRRSATRMAHPARRPERTQRSHFAAAYRLRDLLHHRRGLHARPRARHQLRFRPGGDVWGSVSAIPALRPARAAERTLHGQQRPGRAVRGWRASVAAAWHAGSATTGATSNRAS